MSDSALELEAIRKTYPRAKHPVIDGLDFVVRDREIVALVGESGSGKTTLLRIIAGLEKPDSGDIRIRGRLICRGGRVLVSAEKRGVGLVFQDYALFPHMNVLDNVRYGLRGKTRAEYSERVASLLELAGLENLERRFPHELSGGQQQRVALCRALAPNPALLLLDEPFSNIDPMRRNDLRERLGRIIKESRTTALIVTHDTRDALSVADRIAVIRDGELQQVATPEEVYFHSADTYTAQLFGNVNRIPCQLFQGPGSDDLGNRVLMLRPSELELADGSEKAFITGKVVKSTFMGEYRELVLRCADSDASGADPVQITVYTEPNRQAAIGSTVTIRPTKR